MSKERPPCQIDLKAIISEKAIIVGIHLVTIKANAVLHPYAKIDSTHGPIIIGDSCIVSERAVIQAPSGSPPSGVQIGDHVTIETSAVVQSSVVGQVTTVGAFATLEPASHIGNVWLGDSFANPISILTAAVLQDITGCLCDRRYGRAGLHCGPRRRP